MARPATGTVVEREGARGRSYAIRFTLPNGERRQTRLGREADGWTRRKAEEELQGVLADLRRGLPNAIAEPPAEKPDPLFAAFAFEWFEANRAEWRANTVLDYEWQLQKHLLPFFGCLTLSQITPQQVDRYRQHKVREGEINATSINKTITRLASILETAVEYELIDRNAAKGKRRRVKAPKYRRTYLDNARAIAALLDGAAARDREGRSRAYRRALVATLVFAGLRIDEALSLRWRHVSLASRTLRVAASKTDAGERVVDLLPALADELAKIKPLDADPDALVFGTATGGKQSASNVRNRVLAGAIEKADAALARDDRPELPQPLTPHSLRRTFISLLLALGKPVPYVMRQAGHTDPKVTLSIYAQVMDYAEGETERLRHLIEGAHVDAKPVQEASGLARV